MRWYQKALIQFTLSNMPSGDRVNYWFQKHVTRSLPASSAEFSRALSNVDKFIGILKEFAPRQIGDSLFYEFGAGWDLTTALALYAYGAERQILDDIMALARPELVNDVIGKFQRESLDRFEFARKPGKSVGTTPKQMVSDLSKFYGINYRAPHDARDTGLAAGSVDCITSSYTLQHIPPRDIALILRECHRVLREDGVIIFTIDYQDHYSYVDKRLSAYNFLKYSDRTWKYLNYSLQYQNRLRHRDYVEMFHRAGFSTIEAQKKDGTPEDLDTIKRIKLDKRFANYTPLDLAVRHSTVVLRKAGGAAPTGAATSSAGTAQPIAE